MQNSCKHIDNLMIDYINKKLPDTKKVAFFSHLASCEACRKELSLLYAIKEQSTHLDVSIPVSLSGSVLKNILNELDNPAAAHRPYNSIGCKMADKISRSINKTPNDLVKGIISAVLYPVEASLLAIEN